MNSLFGEWLATTDGRAHYALDDAFLCGSTAKTTGGPIWTGSRRAGGGPILAFAVPYCADCRRINDERWLSGGALPLCRAAGGTS